MVDVDPDRRASAEVRDDAALVARLRSGDERAFEELVESFHPTMLSVARGYVKTRAIAEEVVQEAWLAVLNGIERFEERSSLRTWILRILVNTAMKRGTREARSVPFSSLAPAVEADEPAVEPERFRGRADAFPGHWRAYPGDWGSLPEERLLARETIDAARSAIAELPVAQRTVITLRDIVGCSSEEACETLEISEGNQRVLLHRARSQVRDALERHLDE